MKISEHIYKTSGVEYGTNSNTYAIETEEGLVLIDAGYDDKQWNVINKTLQEWKLNKLPMCKVLITHGHFDHAGNIKKYNDMGIPITAGNPDADLIEKGNPEMEKLFGRPWVCGRVDHRLKDGEQFTIGKSTKITAYHTPGHSKGTYSYLIEVDNKKFVCTSDILFVAPKPPEDAVQSELGYMGGSDFSMDDYQNSIRKIISLDADVLLTGHYYCYYGDVNAVCEDALKQSLEVQNSQKEVQK